MGARITSYNVCYTKLLRCDGAVMCAAVADFTPVVKEDQKTKRGKENWSIELKPTRDT